jgi:Na+-translocating ferredoxin:NAD+ oxidoreductase RnfG subunit
MIRHLKMKNLRMPYLFLFLMRHGLYAHVLFLLFVLATSAQGERYLTIIEAQKLCFPSADKFEEMTVRFTPEQIKAVEKKSEVKVRNIGNKVWLAYQGTNLLGTLFLDYVIGKHEKIDYVVALSPKGEVAQIEILEYRESYGGEIRGKKWRGQFYGKKADSPLRFNGDIYNISGATMSCRHVTEGVKRVLVTHDLVVRSRLDAAGQLSDAAPSGP